MTYPLEVYIREGENIVVDIEGRVAQCGCGKSSPATEVLGYFYEYQGEGSDFANEMCGGTDEKRCGFFRRVHEPINPYTGREGITDHPFTPRGPAGLDRFYCGCRGWD